VVGIGGAVGGFGGILFSGVIPGYIVTYFGYGPMFLIMGSFHLIGLLIAHLLLGEMQPIRKVEAAPV
jgi:ACS family hexuronate transporter-like MFS transporter